MVVSGAVSFIIRKHVKNRKPPVTAGSRKEKLAAPIFLTYIRHPVVETISNITESILQSGLFFANTVIAAVLRLFEEV